MYFLYIAVYFLYISYVFLYISYLFLYIAMYFLYMSVYFQEIALYISVRHRPFPDWFQTGTSLVPVRNQSGNAQSRARFSELATTPSQKTPRL